MAEDERKNYEQKAEIITKKVMSKLYELESKALEARMNTKENIDKLDKELEDIAKQRKDLETKYQDLVNASNTQWRNLSSEFEELVNQINADKQDFYQRAQSWLNDFNEKIADLEDKARNSSQDIRENTRQQLDYLKDQREKLQKSLMDMRKESDQQWHQFRDKIDEGLHSMTTSINNLYQKFQKRREDYSSQKFYENVQSWLNDFNEKISDLEEKTESSTAEVKSTVDEQLSYVREQRDKIQQYLDDMSKTTGEKWKGFRSDIEERINNVRSSITKAYQSFPGGSKRGTTQSQTSGEETTEN
jgi:chromosome segregation ATPase